MGMFDNQRGFDAFYDSRIAYSGSRAGGVSLRRSFRACVVDCGYSETYADVDVASRLKRISVHIPRYGEAGWTDARLEPREGDIIELLPGLTYAVTSVNVLDADEFVVEARER